MLSQLLVLVLVLLVAVLLFFLGIVLVFFMRVMYLTLVPFVVAAFPSTTLDAIVLRLFGCLWCLSLAVLGPRSCYLARKVLLLM